MTNRTAIITGGSRGLGWNTAVNLARCGVDVILTYRANQQEAENLIQEVETLSRKATRIRLDTATLAHLTDSSLKSERLCNTADATPG